MLTTIYSSFQNRVAEFVTRTHQDMSGRCFLRGMLRLFFGQRLFVLLLFLRTHTTKDAFFGTLLRILDFICFSPPPEHVQYRVRPDRHPLGCVVSSFFFSTSYGVKI